MTRLHIVWSREHNAWLVSPDPPDMLRAAAIASFPTLHEAECWVSGTPRCAGRLAVAHDPTLMVDGSCPICGEEE